MSAPSSKSSPKRRPTRGPSPREYREFSVAHQNVLLERMEKMIHVTTEGYASLNEKVDRLSEESTLLGEKVDRMGTEMRVGFKEVDRRFEGVDRQLVELKEGQGRLEEITVEILQRLKSLESRVTALESKVGMLSASGESTISDDAERRIRRLEQRVIALEARAA